MTLKRTLALALASSLAAFSFVGAQTFSFNVDSLIVNNSPAIVVTAAPALNGPVYAASSVESGMAASNAFDGNLTTRWSSLESDPQWLSIDYGSPKVITKAVINWETAYAKAYKIQASNDGTSWSDV